MKDFQFFFNKTLQAIVVGRMKHIRALKGVICLCLMIGSDEMNDADKIFSCQGLDIKTVAGLDYKKAGRMEYCEQISII